MIRDEDLHAIIPTSVQALLESRGWERQRSPFPEAQVWANRSVSDRRIVLPLTRSVDDYADRIAEALKTLASAHGDTEQAWLERLVEARSDVLAFQEILPNVDVGTIGIQEGVSLFAGIRDLLSAGVKSSVRTSPYFGSRHWGAARRFLGTARFGQTRSGSYVVTVLASQSASPEDDVLGDEADVGLIASQRRITTHIMRALDAAKQILLSPPQADDVREETLQRFVEKGVSADLLGAIQRMTWRDGSQVTVSAQWSRLVPVDDDVPSEVTFSHDETPSLVDASELLLESRITEAAEIFGYIEALRRDVADERPAQVTLVVRAGPAPRGAKVRIRFDEEMYERAIEAHQQRMWMRVVGELTRTRTRYWMSNVEVFEPTNAPPTEEYLFDEREP